MINNQNFLNSQQKGSRSRRLLVPALLAAAAMPLSTVSAQDDDDGGFVFEEIIVTATKRPTTLQATPVAVSVTSADTIEKANILDINDLSSVVPSLRVNQLQTSSNTNFAIRGFGNGTNNIGIEPAVGIFIDGVYRSRAAAAIGDLPKLQRIEVLRGPQSTLFGKNASAGVVSVVTAKPSFEPGGYVEAGIGNYNSFQGKAYFTGGLSDTIAFSIGGNFNTRDGYVESQIDGVDDLNERNRWSVRGQLLMEPSDQTSIRLIADYSKIDEACCGVTNFQNQGAVAAVTALGGQLANADDPYALVSYGNFTPENIVDDRGVSLHIDHEWDTMALTSITAYRRNESFNDADSDWNTLDILDRIVNDDRNIKTFTQELRINSTGADNKVDWMLGAYYFDESVDLGGEVGYGADARPYFDALFAGAGLGGFLGTLEGLFAQAPGTFFNDNVFIDEKFTQDDKAWSLFGSVDFHISDTLTLTGGFNYTEDKKRVSASTTNNDVYGNVDFVNGATVFGVPLPTVLFGQFFTDATGLDPTPANIAFIEGVAPGTSAAINSTINGAVLPALFGLQFQPQFLAFPNAVEDGRSKDKDLSWNLRASWEANDWLNVYASAATGFKSSSWNLGRDSRPFFADFGALDSAGLLPNNYNLAGRNSGTRFAAPEQAKVYEIGFKARFDTASVNVAIFDQTIKDFQSATFLGTGFGLTNAGKQSTKGIELEINWQPADWVTLTYGGTFLDPVYDEFVSGVDGVTDLSGERPAGIHGTSMSTGATFNKDFDNGSTAFFRVDWLYESGVQTNEGSDGSITFPLIGAEPGAIRKVSTFNASLGYELASGLQLKLWARNLFNDEYVTTIFPGVAAPGIVNGYRNAPRTWGLNARYTF